MKQMFDKKEIIDIAKQYGSSLPVINLPHETNILEIDYSKYESGQQFIGSDWLGIPEEISNFSKDFIMVLTKQNNTRYVITLYHTGLYEGNTGTYTNYHYADKFEGWTKLATEGYVKTLVNTNEDWVFTLADGTQVTKKVCIKA